MVCPGRNLCRVPEEQREVLRTKWRTGDCTGVYDGEERLEMEISLLLMEEIAKLFAIMLIGICSRKGRTYEILREQKRICDHGIPGHSVCDY